MIERRMGGELELDIDYLLRIPNQVPPTLPVRHICWTDSGRSALLLAAMDVLRCGGKPVVWLPAFCCASVLRAFQQAGFEHRFYSSSDLHLRSSAEPVPQRGETFVFVHYFGHYNRRRAAQAERWRRDGVFIVEDAVQSSLTGGGVGGVGHYVVTSLRKFLPQPDGAMVGSHRPIEVALAGSDETFVSSRVLAKLLRGANAASDSYLTLIERSEARLDASPIVPREISWWGRELMSRADLRKISERRRKNHRVLHRWVAGRWPSALSPLLEPLDIGEVPLGMPVRVQDGLRDALRMHLSSRSVFCPIHWPLPHVPLLNEYAPDHRLASEILTLPIDQRMGEPHVRHLMLLLEEFFGSSK